MNDPKDFSAFHRQSSQSDEESPAIKEKVTEEISDRKTSQDDSLEEIQEEIVKPSQFEIDQAEALIREAAIAKRQGKKTVAQKLLEEADEKAHFSAVVQEALGDELVERSQFRKAKEAYKLAHELDPDNPRIENKYGEMVLKVDLAIDPFVRDNFESMASAKAAGCLSALIPGVGQMSMGQWGKGIAMFIGFGFFLGIALAIPDGLSSIRTSNINGLAYGCLLVAVFFWLWSVFDASSQAKGYTRKQVDRPIPLSDDDFEI